MSGFWSAAAALSQLVITIIVMVLLHDIHLRLKAIERYIKGRCYRCGVDLGGEVKQVRAVICAACAAR